MASKKRSGRDIITAPAQISGLARTEATGPEAVYQPSLPPWLERTLSRYPSLKRRPHPLIAHFPIVYMLSATFFSLLFLATGEQSFDDTAFFCLGAGVLFMPITIVSGFLTHWLNFPGKADTTVRLEKKLSYTLLAMATCALIWRWLNPEVLHQLAGVKILYLLLVLAVTPVVTANSYFGGMLTFPLKGGKAGDYFITGAKRPEPDFD
jgi:uncharacterized membrane protein